MLLLISVAQAIASLSGAVGSSTCALAGSAIADEARLDASIEDSDNSLADVSFIQRALHFSQASSGSRSAVASTSRGLTVRYALLDAGTDPNYLVSTGLPQISSSICHAERNLAPALLDHPAFGQLPDYLIYVNNHTEARVARSLESFLNDTARLRLVNLDQDPDDASRMAPVASFSLDAATTTSLRRVLADTKYMPSGRSRLMLGNDISIVRAPTGLLNKAAATSGDQVLYMAEQHCAEDKEQILGNVSNLSVPKHRHRPFWNAPPDFIDFVSDEANCPWFLADFVYFGSSYTLSRESFYASFYKVYGQFSSYNSTFKFALHGVDQYALQLTVAEAGSQNCTSLSERYVSSCGQDSAVQKILRKYLTNAEVFHDKIVHGCTLG